MITWRMAPVCPAKAPKLTGLLTLALQYGIDSIPDSTLGREKEPLKNMLRPKNSEAPKEIQAEVPKWLYDKAVVQYTDHKALFEAMQQSAPLDLRVNTLKATPDEVIEELIQHGVQAEKGQYSPECVRLNIKPALTQWPIYKEGKVDVQDEGSQLIARLVQPKRGEMVCDFCAGAGGKTLALGALMKSTGRIYAFDVNEKRLAGLTPRMRRAGLSNIHPAVIRNEHDLRVKRLYGKMDRVLVDAPCSGTGTYRRNPDLKWRFGEEELDRINEIQKSVIRSAAKMLKAGGRLVYATCSILQRENQDVINDFLAENINLSQYLLVRPVYEKNYTVFTTAVGSGDDLCSDGDGNIELFPFVLCRIGSGSCYGRCFRSFGRRYFFLESESCRCRGFP